MTRVYDALIDTEAKSLDGFTHIRAYHACRAESIESYKKEGIRVLGYDEMLERAKSTLSFLGKKEAEIQEAFNKIWNQFEKACPRHVYLGIWKEELLNTSGHYLVYGSELITSVAGCLGANSYEAERNQDRLKAIGKPTLILCNIPIDQIDEYWFNGINQAMPIKSDTSLWVDYVAPENIIGFEYPTRMFDPLRWRPYSYNGIIS